MMRRSTSGTQFRSMAIDHIASRYSSRGRDVGSTQFYVGTCQVIWFPRTFVDLIF